MSVPQQLTLDLWTIRCLFNRGRYQERAAAGEYSEVLGKAVNAAPKYNLGPGGKTRAVYYRDPRTNVTVFWIHRLEYADGTLGASGKPDPKMLYVSEHGVEWHPHGGNRWWERLRRDLTDFRPDSKSKFLLNLKKLYGDWRTFKCLLLGPIAATRKVWWRKTAFYVAWLRTREGYAATGRWYRRNRKRVRIWYRENVRGLKHGEKG